MKKQNVGLLVETPFPPVSRANLRLYRLATSLINKNYNVHMISPSTRIFNRYIGNFESKYTLNDNLNFLYRMGTDYYHDKRRYIFPPECGWWRLLISYGERTGTGLVGLA